MKNTKAKILKLIQQGYCQAEIAKELKISRQAVSKMIRQLEKSGQIEKDIRTSVKIYNIKQVDNVNQMPKKQVDIQLTSHTITDKQVDIKLEIEKAYRNHATYIEYPLESCSKEALAKLCKDKGMDFKQWAISNNYPLSIFRHDGIELRLNNRSIIIVPPDILLREDSALPFNITQYLLRLGWKIAKEAESLYNVKIKQINSFYVGALVRQELAQTNNELSNNILEKKKAGEISIKEKTFRIIDPDSDRKCFEFDDSSGEWLKKLKEAEATDPLNADNHATSVHIMLDDVLHHNAWQNIQESLKHTALSLEEVTKIQQEQTKFFVLHNELITTINKKLELLRPKESFIEKLKKFLEV